MRIVIVGAGVAGCIMARQLSRLPGAEVTCLERVAADDHSESGTGLNICPNAVTAMSACDPELAAAVTEASFPWSHWRVSLTDGTVLFDLPMAQVAEMPGWRIRWSELYRVLRTAAAPSVRYGCTIARVGREAADPARCFVEWTEGGAHHRLGDIDLLIAADGRYSELRRSFSGEPARRFVGVAISRVLVPDTSGGLVDEYEQWFNGPNRLLAYRVPPDHIYIAAAFPIAAEAPIPDHLKEADALREAFTSAEGLTSQTEWLVETVCAHGPHMHWARMQEHDVLFADADSHVLYVGDAAHGMVPTLAQGATQAIEGSLAAADLITRRWHEGCRDPRRWLAEIDTLRRARLAEVMALSLAATDTMLEGADPVAGTLHKTTPEFLARLRRLYGDTGLPERRALEPAIGRLTA